jgi:hypothetical protein
LEGGRIFMPLAFNFNVKFLMLPLFYITHIIAETFVIERYQPAAFEVPDIEITMKADLLVQLRKIIPGKLYTPFINFGFIAKNLTNPDACIFAIMVGGIIDGIELQHVYNLLLSFGHY